MKTSVFFRLLASEDKGGALLDAIDALREGGPDNPIVYAVEPESFRQVPGTPFAYWVSERIRRLFTELPPFESDGRTVKQGLATADDFRFVRAWWEVPAERILDAANGPDWREDLEAFQTWCRKRTYEGKRWAPFAKGGEYSPYYADIHLVVNWERDGAEMRAFSGSVIRNPDYYFRPGLTYISRTSLRLCATPLFAGSVFSHVGPGIFPRFDDLQAALARFNSYTAEAFIALYHARGTEGDDQTKKYEVGLLQLIPWPDYALRDEAESIQEVVASFQRRASMRETGKSFCAPIFGDAPSESIADAILRVERLAAEAYGLTLEDSFTTACSEASTPENIRADVQNGVRVALDWPDRARQTAATVAYCIGCLFGRWDIRFMLKDRPLPRTSDPFAPPPVCPPGMLTGDDGLPAREAPADYQLRISWDGVLVDDPGHQEDVIGRIREVIGVIWEDRAEDIYREAVEILDPGRASRADLRPWLRREFFERHIKQYSKSRRKAPIYWELATSSHSYAVWLYYHRFTPDTVYKVLNDYVKPKLDHEQRKLDRLRADAGPEPTRSQRAEIDRQETFVAELKTFAEEIERIAPLFSPDLNDGAIINFAPLWRLVPQHRAWQKECKKCWDKLVAGDYDWAHLAMHLWPERVVPKCRSDASLAIAHGLDKVFWQQNEKGKWIVQEEPEDGWETVIDCLIAERSGPAVKAALESLLNAPAPSSSKKRRKTSQRRTRAK